MEGTLLGSFDELFEAGCIQTGGEEESLGPAERLDFTKYFEGIMGSTQNNPCNGCPVYNGGKCKAFKKFHTSVEREGRLEKRKRIEVPKETVSQAAERLGISKNEVRRRKHAGQL